MINHIKNTKKTKKYYITILPIIAVMITIFVFSARTAEESGQDSSLVVQIILNVYSWLTGGKQPSAEELIPLSLVVRKLAHFFEYCLLSMCVMLHLFEYKMINLYRLIIAVAFCAAYAATDEFHQLFVPGRAGTVTDVLIDTCGALTGAVLAVIIARIYYVLKSRREFKKACKKEA